MMTSSIFVISLPESISRRERFIARANLADVSVEVVDAHTKPTSDLLYNPEDALRAKGRTLHAAELGVYSSHFSIWKKIIHENISHAFIFEDDVVVDWALLPEVEAMQVRFPKLHYLRLFAKRPCRMRILTEDLSAGRCLVDYRGYAYGAQAYFITRQAAAILIRQCQKVRMAIDDEMDRSWEHGLANLAIFPFPAFEEHVPSTIGTHRFTEQKKASTCSSARFRFRVTDRLMRLKQEITGFGRVDWLDLLR